MSSHRLRIVLALSSVLAAATAAAAPLELVTEDYPPFNFQKPGGSVVGISTEILEKTFHTAGLEFKVTLMPWARAFAQGLHDPNTCVYSTTRTPDRESSFKWVGPLAHNDWTLFGRADSPKLSNLSDAKAHTVGGYRGDALTQYLEAQGFKVDEAATDAANARKLAAKRIDFWATGKALAPFLAAREGVKDVAPVFTIRAAQLYLACNKAVSDETIARLDGALKKLARDGTTANIAQSYAR